MSVVIDGTLGITSPAETVQGALTTTGNTILGDASTDTLNVGNGGLVKDASGNVGIGTSSPNGKLSVLGGAVGAVNFDFGNTTAQAVGAEARLRLQPSTIFSITNPTLSPYISAIQTNAANSASDIAFGSWSGTALIEIMRLQASGNLLFNSGYGSAATAYGCRAWVNFNGTGTVAVRASGNVSSITDNGTGDYTVNFTTAMPDGNYMATQSTGNNNWGLNAIPAATNGTSSLLLQSTTQYRIYTSAASGGTTNSDTAVVFVAIFR